MTKYSLKEEELIFIISQPRSGSTYLQNLLSNNTEVNTCSEPWILLNFVNQIKPILINTTFDNSLAHLAFNDYLSKYKIDFNLKQRHYLLNLYDPLADGFKYVIDKTPRYWEIMEEISLLFPNSKIIVLKRNPIDVARSIIKTWKVDNLERLTYYKRDLLIAPNQIEKFCIKNNSNPNVFVLKYEDLILNTENTVISLYQWIGLRFDFSVLETNNNKKFKGLFGDPFQNSSSYTLAKKEVSSKKLNALFEDFLRGYSAYLGSDFLRLYGNYEDQNIVPKNTIAFKYFVYFTDKMDTPIIFKDIYWRIKKSLFYQLIKRKG